MSRRCKFGTIWLVITCTLFGGWKTTGPLNSPRHAYKSIQPQQFITHFGKHSQMRNFHIRDGRSYLNSNLGIKIHVIVAFDEMTIWNRLWYGLLWQLTTWYYFTRVEGERKLFYFRFPLVLHFPGRHVTISDDITRTTDLTSPDNVSTQLPSNLKYFFQTSYQFQIKFLFKTLLCDRILATFFCFNTSKGWLKRLCYVSIETP